MTRRTQLSTVGVPVCTADSGWIGWLVACGTVGIALIDVLSKVSNIISSPNRCLIVLLCKVDAGRFTIRIVVGAPNVVEVRELVDHSLNFLRVVRVIECEVTNVDLLCPVCWVDIGIRASTTTRALAALTHIGSTIHHAGHRSELLLCAGIKLCL